VSLFDADDYLTLADEPAEPAPQPNDETGDPVVALLDELPADATEAQVDAVLEEVALIEQGPIVAEPEFEREIEPEAQEPSVTQELPAHEPAVTNESPVTQESRVTHESPAADVPVVRAPSVDQLWDGLVFQDSAVSALRAAERNPVHAYLLLGLAGNGTLRAATSFAAALLCPRGGCGECGVCSRVLHRSYPDVVVVEREGASISVDQAREIIRLALRSPVEGDRKVLILTDFHLVTNAGPTLLKIIEEPPPSTIFLILADHLPPELITIASRCVQVPFTNPTSAQIISALIARDVPVDRAERVAEASGGQLDRAELLATDEHLAARLAFWSMLPSRLDGSGAAVVSLCAEAVMLLDGAAIGPLEARQAAEAEALEARIEQTGTRGAGGQRKELADRHKREVKRLRDDELRLGLSVLLRRYRTALVRNEVDGPSAVGALEAISTLNEHLDRNPNVNLALSALLLKLPTLSAPSAV
jgi:DNA polymerase III subunit delta'